MSKTRRGACAVDADDNAWVWVLSETPACGRPRIVAVALTQKAASAWVRRRRLTGERRTKRLVKVHR